MSFFEKIIYALQREMETPQAYGPWHIAFLLLTAAVSVLFVWRYRNASDKVLRRLLLVVWAVLAVLEIYKQVVYSMDVTDGVATWGYQWYAFPFQFCSTPLYGLPFIIFLKDGRVRNAFMAFFATFSLFAGLAVMVYPGDVFIRMIGIDIQTMVHHGGQVVVGVLLVARNRHRLNREYLLGSIAVFVGFVAVAMTLNLAVHAALVAAGKGDTFNMFFISPYHDCTLPVLSGIDPLVPYPVFLLIYLVGFGAVSALVFGIEKGIVTLIGRARAAKKA